MTYLTLGAGRLAAQMGTQALGRVATGLGVSQAAQTAFLCPLYTIDRLMTPLRTYEQLANLTSNIGRIRQAIQRGDYQGMAAILGRTVPTLPGLVNNIRESARLAQTKQRGQARL